MFLIMTVGMFYFAEGFLLPVVLAFLAALILSPVVRGLRANGIPEAVSAVLLVGVLALGLAGASYTLRGPVTRLIDDAPRIGSELRLQRSEARRVGTAAVSTCRSRWSPDT